MGAIRRTWHVVVDDPYLGLTREVSLGSHVTKSLLTVE